MLSSESANARRLDNGTVICYTGYVFQVAVNHARRVMHIGSHPIAKCYKMVVKTQLQYTTLQGGAPCEDNIT